MFIAIKVRDKDSEMHSVTAEINHAKQLFGIRSRAIRNELPYINNTLDVSKVTKSSTAYIAKDYVNGCVWVYFIDGKDELSEKAFRQMVGSEQFSMLDRISINKGKLSLPPVIGEKLFNNDKNLVLLNLSNIPNVRRFEIWSKKALQKYISENA